jgi:hypothetical protein
MFGVRGDVDQAEESPIIMASQRAGIVANAGEADSWRVVGP